MALCAGPLCPLLYLAIIVLMFVIIHSLRRSIREERTLDKRNVWYRAQSAC